MDSLHTPKRPDRAPHFLSCLAAAAATAFTTFAGAQANPFYVGAAQSLASESNLFRGIGGVETSDTVSVTSLLAGLDQPIGRQRLFADGVLRVGRFADNSQLNHSGGGLSAGIDWEAAESLSGRLSYATDRSLSPTGVDLGISPTLRNLQTTQEFLFRGLSSKVAMFAAEAGLAHRSLTYSADIAAANGLEFKQNTGNLGLLYRPSGGLTFGFAIRRTEGSYPFAAAGAADDFRRDDIDLSALWAATGASTITARLSSTRERHDVLTTRNVSGTTGALAWNFKPTGKLNLTADFIRDTGAEATFNPAAAGAGGVPTVVNSSPQATTVQLRGDYEATGKLQVVALARQLQRDLVNTVGGTGDDTLTEMRLGLNWTPLRSVLVGCSVGREERDASNSATLNGLSTSYSATTVRCQAQFRTQ